MKLYIAIAVITSIVCADTFAADLTTSAANTYERTVHFLNQPIPKVKFTDVSIRTVIDTLSDGKHSRTFIIADLPEQELEKSFTLHQKKISTLELLSKIADITNSDLHIVVGGIKLVHRKEERRDRKEERRGSGIAYFMDKTSFPRIAYSGNSLRFCLQQLRGMWKNKYRGKAAEVKDIDVVFDISEDIKGTKITMEVKHMSAWGTFKQICKKYNLVYTTERINENAYIVKVTKKVM